MRFSLKLPCASRKATTCNSLGRKSEVRGAYERKSQSDDRNVALVDSLFKNEIGEIGGRLGVQRTGTTNSYACAWKPKNESDPSLPCLLPASRRLRERGERWKMEMETARNVLRYSWQCAD